MGNFFQWIQYSGSSFTVNYCNVRNLGIMGKIVGMLKAKGFNTYSHEACIFVCPPLIITEEELAENMAILDEVLTEVDKMV